MAAVTLAAASHGFRLHQRQNRSTDEMGRDRIGRPSTNFRSSSASSRAERKRSLRVLGQRLEDDRLQVARDVAVDRPGPIGRLVNDPVDQPELVASRRMPAAR